MNIWNVNDEVKKIIKLLGLQQTMQNVSIIEDALQNAWEDGYHEAEMNAGERE